MPALRALGLVLVAAAMTLGQPGDAGAQGPIGKVAVAASGAISYDGQPVTLEALKTRLADLKRQNGVVWYYREETGKESPAAASTVVKLIIEAQLPVSLSTKPDYSNVIMPDGIPRPRGAGARPN